MQHIKPNTESGIKPDIVLPDGTRLRSLPWGGRQCAGMGIRTWDGGFEVVDLHPGTMEPFPETATHRFVEILDAVAWARYLTARTRSFFFDDPEPAQPAVKPLVTPPNPPPVLKRTNPRTRATLTFS